MQCKHPSMVSNAASAGLSKTICWRVFIASWPSPFVLLSLLSYKCKAIQCESQSLCTSEWGGFKPVEVLTRTNRRRTSSAARTLSLLQICSYAEQLTSPDNPLKAILVVAWNHSFLPVTPTQCMTVITGASYPESTLASKSPTGQLLFAAPLCFSSAPNRNFGSQIWDFS